MAAWSWMFVGSAARTISQGGGAKRPRIAPGCSGTLARHLGWPLPGPEAEGGHRPLVLAFVFAQISYEGLIALGVSTVRRYILAN